MRTTRTATTNAGVLSRWVRTAAGVMVVGVVTVAATACGGEDDSVGGPTTRFTLLPTTTTTLAPETTSTVATTIASTTTTTVAAPVTVTAPTSTLPEGSIDPDVARALELSGDGIGAAAFTADPDGVVAYIGSFLGAPTDDSGWIDPFSVGSCPGTVIRTVSWGSLTATFGDVSSLLDGQRHFFAYAYEQVAPGAIEPAGLRTAAGITLGSRLVDVLAAYPTSVINPSDEFTPPNFVVDDNLRGFVDGLADDSTVVGLFGGQGCGE